MKSSTLLAFIGGAALGATIALLLAPEKGSETQRKIKKTIDEEMENLREKITDFTSNLVNEETI